LGGAGAQQITAVAPELLARQRQKGPGEPARASHEGHAEQQVDADEHRVPRRRRITNCWKPAK
jgi:hypothetical protein